MRVRGNGFPSEDEIFWEISETRVAADCISLEFRHSLITHEQVRVMSEHLEELVGKEEAPEELRRIIENKKKRATARMIAWRERCEGQVN